MLHVDGYSGWRLLQETPSSEVYTGTRQADGLRVVLKLYRGRSEAACLRAKREFELLQRIQHEGVVRPVELREHADRHVLILERVAGYPLSQRSKTHEIDVDEVLAIGLGIARSLAAVHDARVIHKDLKLGNILMDPERLRTCLIDFGISAEFGRAERASPPQSAEGTMSYMAPEQTARVGLGVDFRTDLYSLGVVLYELLAGRTPFGARTPLELIHAHIAERPRPLIEIDARIPDTLSRIVMKLLEKDPERRYQTARGLVADLEQCQKQLRSRGEIDEELVLGTEDASDRLRFPRKLYGRERECAELLESFERIARGGFELVLLAGPAGIGKSSLPSVLRERLACTGGYLAEAKFDPDLRERPYAGFVSALTDWVDQVLAERSERHRMWCEEIRASLGAIGGVMVELAPNLAYVVDDFPAVPTLPPHEARERLSLGLIRFVRTIARPDHPLVLVLDDLQWADAGSLFLLDALLRSTEPGALLVVGGLRDSELNAEHPVSRLLADLSEAKVRITRLVLEPLRLEDTTAMLAEALDRAPEDVAGLARCVGSKCQHNPLLVRRLMFHLWDRNLLRHEHGRGWVWDERQLEEAEITEDAAAMVAARIHGLSAHAGKIVKVASLIGTVFDVETIVSISDAHRLDTLKELMCLVEQGLIAPCRDGFKFVHDRIREAALSGLTADERASLHHRAGRLLLERTAPEGLHAVAFQIAEHVSGSLDRLTETERPRSLEALFLAGKTALEKGATGTASHYLGLARSLLTADDWDARLELSFEIQLRSAEASFQLGRWESALELLDALEEHPVDAFKAARAIAQRVSIYCLARPHDALNLTLGALRRFGWGWARSPSLLRVRVELLRTDWSLRGPLDQTTFSTVRQHADLSWMAPILVAAIASGPLTQHSNRLSLLCAAYALRAFHRHGLVDRSPAFGLATYATFRILVRRDLRGAERYARAAARWSDILPHGPTDLRCRGTLEAYVFSWIKPRRRILEPPAAHRERGARAWQRRVERLRTAAPRVVRSALGRAARGHRAAHRGAQSRRADGRRGLLRGVPAHLRSAARAGGGPDQLGRRARCDPRLCQRRPSSDVYIGVQWVAVLCILGQFEPHRPR